MSSILTRIFAQEDLNFLLTNRIPRQALTRFMGWFSQLENPLVRSLSIWTWKQFSDLDLSEARQTHFSSMHACFIRELKEGARPVDSNSAVLSSPCDAIVGAHGTIEGTQLIQAKGFPYSLMDLLGDESLVHYYTNGSYVTLRLKSSMYHRFHAPHDCHISQVNYISGDTWNVNPIALKRVEKLFCKNERAVIQARLKANGDLLTLVPVAAVLVASMRFHFIDALLHIRYRGPNVIACNADFAKGQELGWFQHGSTIIVFAPSGYTFCEGIEEGATIRMGQGLMKMPG